ncbi:palmitoyltransferase ZDHHC12 [Prinia subflava]|uniref:palmitoyltransferase ZDHHC12 n=1 Tax=Prinia subflava TaxID=208062 RepID=UPI002FE1728E
MPGWCGGAEGSRCPRLTLCAKPGTAEHGPRCGAQHPSGASPAGLGRPGPASGRCPSPVRPCQRCPEAFRAGGARGRRSGGSMGPGGLWVRAAHTALSAALLLGLLLHRTDMQKQEERGELLQPLIFVLLVLCSVLLYFKVSLMDPGFVKPEEEVKEGENKGQGVVIPQIPGDIKLRRCGYCLVKQPMRAKHCQLCQHCVRRYDHHCPWLENCVGERNHPLFIVYLSVQLVVLLWGGHVAWSGLYFEQSREWLQHNIFLLVSFLLIFIFTIVVLLLLVSHLYLISCNTTTWEFMSPHRISYLRHSELENPFDQGIILNLWRFFCSRHLTAWENIYFHRNTEPV